jgi:hypothetical protein
MEELRAAYQPVEQTSRPNNYYPFWNMKVGEQAIIRFLPDSNENNPLGFMVEKLMHTLTINGEDKSVPCRKMYNEECPICKVSSAYYKEEDKVSGKKYWRKKQHLAQALIIEDPLPADKDTNETYEGKVRFVALGWQLFNVIKEAFESGELDTIPYAYEGGCNFIIKKTKSGEHDGYAIGSKFARKSTDLDEDEIAFVEEQMIDLITLLPNDYGEEKVDAMLQADLTGSSYTTSGTKSSATKTTAADFKEEVAQKIAESSKEKDDEPVSAKTETSESEFETEADEILARIHARRGQK